MIPAYPLQWPEGWPRTTSRKSAKFSKGERKYSSQPGSTNSWIQKRDLTIGDGTQRVLRELAALGVRTGDGVISTDLKLRLDGLPYSDQRAPADPGVAVYWQRPGDKAPRVMAIDIYDRIADNLAAIAATLEAMRAIERHGGAQILERAFTGFTALAAPASGWREVLGFPAGAMPAYSEVEERYKTLRGPAHPDKGGTAEQFMKIQSAFDQAHKELCK